MTVLGGAYVLYDLRPKISVAEDRSIDESDPLESRFTLTNHSFFSLHYVQVGCHVYDLVTSHNVHMYGDELFYDETSKNRFVAVSGG